MSQSLKTQIKFDVEFNAGATIRVEKEVFEAWMKENGFDEDDELDYLKEQFIQEKFKVDTFHRDYSGKTSYISLVCREDFRHEIYHESYEDDLRLTGESE